MDNIEQLTEYVRNKAKSYLEETGETIDVFPSSIVDFVIEHVSQNCHFPSHFKEANIVADLERGKNTLAMACVDVYAKIGIEGQIGHTENSVTRQYDSAWITSDVISQFPNYVSIL